MPGTTKPWRNKTELREVAQKHLLISCNGAFYRIWDDDDLTPQQKRELEDEVSRQMGRIEKLFGYRPGTWERVSG